MTSPLIPQDPGPSSDPVGSGVPRPRHATRRGIARRSMLVGVAGLTVAGTLLVGRPAAADPVPPTDQAASIQVLAKVESRLGEHYAGGYLDASHRPVATVTDAASAATARSLGAVARTVRHSRSALRTTSGRLEAALAVPGTGWATDPATNQVVVSYDSTVTGAALARVKAATAKLGDAVRLEAVAGTFSTRISGGDAIYGGGYRCSLGFNVSISGQRYLLTAGHCGNVASTWYTDSSQRTRIGPTVNSRFPGTDYALVRYDNASVSADGTVGSVNITSAANATVGQQVTRRGSTTGLHSGRVTALNATVNYAEGRVSGLIRTTVCAEPGDSGGSLYSGSTALGLTSGGSGDCRRGGITYFQPVVPALNAYGATVL